MIVYQYDAAGIYQGQTEADESPLEPGVWLMPARTTMVAPPDEIPEGRQARWNGVRWDLINQPRPKDSDPVAKLTTFLAANPDVAALLSQAER
ncbi:phage tail protein [Halopseudomonas bauzanensis]|uniref:phage tail protein n=1 Tax=Halopseudomonas bauzanensis TaxID=653930 RepID=UPI0035242F07